MRFDWIELNGFGTLNGKIQFARDGMNLIVADNEQGKSTLARSLVATLFGLETEKKKEQNGPSEWERYFPWSDGAYAITARIETEKGPVVIHRDFRANERDITLPDEQQEWSPDDFPPETEQTLGTFLTGMSRDVFEKSVIVLQEDVPLDRDTDELLEMIQQLVDTSSGKATAREAQSILDRARDEFSGKDGETVSIEEEMARVRSRIDEREEELHQLRSDRRRAEEKLQEARELEAEIEELDREIDRMEFIETVSRKRELEEQLEKSGERQKRLEQLRDELSQLEAYGDFPSEDHEELLRAHEKRNQAQTELTSITAQLENTRETLEGVNEQLEQEPALSDLDVSELNELADVLDRARREAEDLEESREHRKRAKSDLQDPDELRVEHRDLHQIFRDLSPEDREFLTNLDANLQEIADRETELEREISKTQEEISEIDTERDHQQMRSLFIGALGGVVVTGGIAWLIWLSGLTTGVTISVFGLGIITFAVIAFVHGRNHRADERSEWSVKEEQYRDRQMELLEERQDIQKRATRIAAQLGLVNYEVLLDQFNRYRSLYDRLESLLHAEARWERQRTRFKSLLERNSELIDQLPEQLTVDTSPETLSDWRERAETCRNQIRERTRLETDLADLRAQKNQLERRLKNAEQTMEDILRRADISVENKEYREAVEQFKTDHEQYQRYQSIREKIPEIESELLPDEEIERKKKRYDRLEESVERIREERQDLSLPDELDDTEEYRRRRQTLTNQKESMIADHADMERDVRSLESRYRQRLPDLQDEMEELNDYHRRLVELNGALDMATSTLAEVSSEVHAEWARILNEESTEFLEHISERYGDVRFQSDLSFHVKDRHHEQDLRPDEIQTSLSTGTADLIYLAVRLGLGQFFSKNGEDLPIILDETFAQFDDNRFHNAMKSLPELLLPDQQVLYLTAHRSRIRFLEEKDEDLFAEHIHEISLPAPEKSSSS